MNPVEDEAVVSQLLLRAQGKLVTSELVPSFHLVVLSDSVYISAISEDSFTYSTQNTS